MNSYPFYLQLRTNMSKIQYSVPTNKADHLWIPWNSAKRLPKSSCGYKNNLVSFSYC